MIKYIFFPLLILLLINASCDNTNSEGDKNPREYTFTFDTLVSIFRPDGSNAYQTIMNHIWGNSSDDVWASGHVSSGDEIFHYDGISWSPVQTSPPVSGWMKGEVYGFGPNNIWIIGARGSSIDSIYGYSIIGHYDGNNWEKAKIPDETGRELLTIWGKNPNDIWAGGREGTLFHYDGTEWKLYEDLELPGKASIPGSIFKIEAIAGNDSNDIYMGTIVFYDIYSYNYLYKYENSKWNMIDSGFVTDKYFINLWVSPEGNLYSGLGGWPFSRYDGNGNWTNLTNDDLSISNIDGSSDDNIFVLAWNPFQLFHYNGIDFYEYKELNDVDIATVTDVWIDGNEVFVTGWFDHEGVTKTLIIHGK